LQQINAIAPQNPMDSAKPSPITGDAVAKITAAATSPLVVPNVVPNVVPKAEMRPASIAAVVSTPAPTPRPTTASLPPTPPSSQNEDSSISATRPPLRFAYPDYPDVHARGIVALTAQVDPDGAVRTVKVVAGNRALAAAAVRAVRQWRYRPYLKDGRPVATETNIVISFISDDAISMSFPPSLPPTP